MRITVNVPQEQSGALKALAKHEQISCAELIRRAVAEYLARRAPNDDDAAFGLWRDRADVEGVAYQQRIRQEWSR